MQAEDYGLRECEILRVKYGELLIDAQRSAVSEIRDCLDEMPERLEPTADSTLKGLWDASQDSGDMRVKRTVQDLVTVMMVYSLYVDLRHHPTYEEYVAKAKEILGDNMPVDRVIKAYKEVTRAMPHAFESKSERSGRQRKARKARSGITEAARLPGWMKIYEHTAQCAGSGWEWATRIGGLDDLSPGSMVGVRMPPGISIPGAIAYCPSGVGAQFGCIIIGIKDLVTGQLDGEVGNYTHIFPGTTFLYIRLRTFNHEKFKACFGFHDSIEVEPNLYPCVQGPICQNWNIDGLPHLVDGKSIQDAGLRKVYGFNVLMICRAERDARGHRKIQYLDPEPTTILKEGDRLILSSLVASTSENLWRLCDDNSASPASSRQGDFSPTH